MSLVLRQRPGIPPVPTRVNAKVMQGERSWAAKQSQRRVGKPLAKRDQSLALWKGRSEMGPSSHRLTTYR
jgi:hypothetical protein